MANQRVAYIEKQLIRQKQQNEERMAELDRLYKENDKYKESLSTISLKYDFEHYDKTMKFTEYLLDWATRTVEVLPELSKKIEANYSCGICNGLAENITEISPCHHIFCGECLANQVKHKSKCYTCGE